MPKKHPFFSSRLESIALIFLLLAGAGLRWMSQWYASQLPFWTHYRLDAQIYHEAGLRIASGDWLLGKQVLHMSPLYSYTVGLFYTIFGVHPWVLPCFQSILGIGLIFLTWAIARQLWQHAGWSLCSAALCAFYGPAIFYEGHLLAATLGAFLWALLTWRTLCALESSTLFQAQAPPSKDLATSAQIPQQEAAPSTSHIQLLKAWAWVGACWGLCVLLRPNVLLLLPLYGLVLVMLHRRAFLGPLLAFGIAGAILIAPVTLRNRVVAGEWVLVTDSGGLNFYIGNGPGAHGTFRRPPGLEAAGHPAQQFVLFRRVAEQASGRRLTSREVDAFWYRQTWRDIRQDPLRWLRLLRDKLWLFWSATELSNSQDYGFTRTLNPVLGAPLVQFGWLSPWAILGLLWLLWLGLGSLRQKDAPKKRKEALLGLWLAVGTLTLIVALVGFFILARYRLFLFSSLLLLSVAAARQMTHWLLKDPKKAGIAALLVVGMYPLIYTTWLKRSIAEEYFKLGYAYHVQGRSVQAEQSYLRALRHDALHLSSHKNLARLYETSHRSEEARFHWQQLLDAPRAPMGLKRLAQQRLMIRPSQKQRTTSRPLPRTMPPTSKASSRKAP